MLTTVREELAKKGTDRQESIYLDTPESVMDYKLTVGDFVESVSAEKAVEDFNVLQEYYATQMEVYAQCEEYNRSKERLRAVKKQLKEKKVSEEQMLALRQERKEISKKINHLGEELEKQVEAQLGFAWKEKKVLCYKNTVFISWIEDLKKRLGQLEKLRLEHVKKHPLFISNLKALEEAVGYGEQIGMVGGPCLFGMDEVIIHIGMEDGREILFDSCCGRRCLNEDQTEETLEQFTARHREDIRSVRIENRKNGITRQEYDSIRYLFAFAEVFRARVVIPLPDISYFKYASSDLHGLKEELYTESMERFKEECFRISDLYLEYIETIASDHPSVEYCVLHARNERLVSLFYEKRNPYIENSGYIQKITNISGKKDSVIDYITMLALPYYVYGTKSIVQLDSVDETDSGRKCNKIHKGDIRLTQILYPEYLSRDGKHTIYNSAFEYKDYR
ncbi:MAG: hypothetical protein E7294_04495 [Lachnospiraceae bacterium]|nr:hypothetical protein [Lachnospiraceae bacterium]